MTSDVVYARHGGVDLIATLYRPAGDGPFPAVVSLHGGAWTSGDRFGTALVDGALRDGGAVVVAADFRMPPAARYPAAVDDARAAIRWLVEHAADLHVRSDAIGIVGASSGGQTALLCALDPRPGDELAFAVACWPIADPPARYRMARERGLARLVAAHDAYFGDEATMAAASPQRIVESGAARALPPLLIVQGTADENVTPEMAPAFAAAYGAAGGAVDVRLFPGQPHSFITSDGAASAEALERIVAFVCRPR